MTLFLIHIQAALAQMPPMPSDHPTAPGQDWYIPLAVVVGGFALGYILLNRQTAEDDVIEAESRRIDLRSTRDEVVEALRQLEMEEGKMEPAQYQAERQTLIGRGARAIAVLEGADVDETSSPEAPAPEAPAPEVAAGLPAPAPAPGGLAPEWRGAAYTLGVVALVGGLFFLARQGSQERTTDMGMTGGAIVNADNEGGPPQGGPPPPGSMASNPQFQAMKEQLELRLAADPNDIDALNGLTQLHFTHEMPQEAFDYNSRALELDDKNHDARVYRGILSLMMGMQDRALELIAGVLAEEPLHPKALTYNGLILLELERFDEAVANLEKAVAQQPGNQMIERALDDARALARGEIPARMAAPPPAAAGDLIVSGTVNIDPAAKAGLTGNETVFVSVKDPAQAGPPIAAERMVAQFPGRFELTTDDIRAMGSSTPNLPATMTLTVRVDLDGNAMTKEAAPLAVVEGVRLGTANVPVTLSMSGAPQAAGAAPAGAAEVLASGTATLGPSAAFTGAETVFISIKDPAGGPPLAADRRVGASFPLQFQMTTANLLPMAGNRPVPDPLVVSVRIDRDGNATTKDGAEASASVAKGATGVSLSLQ